MMLAESYARTGQHVKATEVFKRLCCGYHHPPVPSLYSAMIDAHLLTGQKEMARICYERVREWDASFPVDARIEDLQKKAPQPSRATDAAVE
jgi:hypothetical protein